MTDNDILARQGRPIPPPPPALTDVLSQIVAGVNKLGGKLTDARHQAVRTALGGVLSNVQADLKALEVDAAIKANAAAVAAAKAILAKQTTPAPVGAVTPPPAAPPSPTPPPPPAPIGITSTPVQVAPPQTQTAPPPAASATGAA